MADELCACGEPLHYTNLHTRRYVESVIADLGPAIAVTVNRVSYLVPRHYIALHGLKAAELTELAERYGWPLAGETYEGRHRG